MTIRVLLADDHRAVREVFRALLEKEPGLRVVAEASDGEAAVAQARRLRPDVCLVDIRMPRLDGLEVVRRLCGPDVDDPIPVVVVTTFDKDRYVYDALRGGASGFILKRSAPALLVESVRSAMAGDQLISPQVTVRLLRHLSDPQPARGLWEQLTDREREIAYLVADGGSNADIAEQLVVSPATVKNHLFNIQRKLDVGNRVQVAAEAWRNRAVG